MKARIKYIKDAANQSKERVVILVMEDCDIGAYMVMDTTYDNEGISNKLRHTYWFPDKKVKKDDLVILYTKEGEDSEKENDSGNTSHFFYWDLKETVWNKDEDCAVLFEIQDFMVKES